LVAALGSQNQDGQARRDQQFHQARKVVSIDVRSERNPAELNLAHPIQFSIESKMLQNGEDRHGKSKNQQEPDEAMPVFQFSIRLRAEKKQRQQRGVLEQSYTSLKRIDRDAGRQLQGRHSPQTEERP